ncbi:hypothetical protein OH710_20190, partial [Pseudomonas capsici]|uniref:calcium-binding protein n=1 Tax=Pseudomonas capsici TaxID=2810614 RepID=UPI00298DC3F5
MAIKKAEVKVRYDFGSGGLSLGGGIDFGHGVTGEYTYQGGASQLGLTLPGGGENTLTLKYGADGGQNGIEYTQKDPYGSAVLKYMDGTAGVGLERLSPDGTKDVYYADSSMNAGVEKTTIDDDGVTTYSKVGFEKGVPSALIGKILPDKTTSEISISPDKVGIKFGGEEGDNASGITKGELDIGWGNDPEGNGILRFSGKIGEDGGDISFDFPPFGVPDFRKIGEDLKKEMEKSFGRAEDARSPLILDLDGDGVETLSTIDGIHFDHDGNGFSERSGWVGKDDGLLVWDRNQDGRVDQGSELFGNNTSTSSGQKAANGFLALADLDENQDGVFDIRDSAYGKLNVWVDKNSDGAVDEGEFLTLEQAGVKSINLDYVDPGKLDANGDVPRNVVDVNGNEHRQVGSYTRADGSVGVIEDVWFDTSGMDTIDNSDVEISAEILALPEIEGFGNVHSLQRAMAGDPALKSLVESFKNESDAAARKGIVVDLIYHWAGVQDIDPASRAANQIYGNVIGDARKLATLEAFLGTDYLGTWCWGTRDPNPHGPAAGILLQAFDNFVAAVYDKLMLQTHFLDMLDGLTITIDEAGYQWDISPVLERLKTQYDSDPENGAGFISEFGQSLQGIGEFGERLLEMIRMEGRKGTSDFDVLLSDMAINKTTGGVGNDLLNGTDSSDSLNGVSGNDRLYGGSGDDVLVGGEGDDYLVGGDGADTYIFNLGDGRDTIFNSDTDAENSKVDTIVFGAGISVGDVLVKRNYYDLILQLEGRADSITVQSYFDDVTVANHGYAVDQIRFSDGTVWLGAHVLAMAIESTDANDQIWGYSTDDIINGGLGNDILYGFAGNDTLSGSEGNDKLYGDIGADSLEGGDGDDELNGGEGNDLLMGDAGQDVLYGNAGNDTISGGEGDDYLSGGEGNDTLRGNAGKDALYGDAGDDELNGGEGEDDLYGNEGNDILGGDEGNDRLYGGVGDDILLGGAGDDYLDGGLGNDQINGGNGDDVIDGGDGNDIIHGGAGNDIIDGGYGVNQLFGEAGDDVLKANVYA